MSDMPRHCASSTMRFPDLFDFNERERQLMLRIAKIVDLEREQKQKYGYDYHRNNAIRLPEDRYEMELRDAKDSRPENSFE